MTNMTFPALRLLSMEPAGRLASHAYPIKRVRKGPGKRGHTTKTCPVRSEVSRLRMSAPAGCCTTFQLRSEERRVGKECGGRVGSVGGVKWSGPEGRGWGVGA